MNYSELVAEIQSYTENQFSTADINTFIAQAEQRIYNTVQLPALRKNVVGVATINNKYLTCPSDWLATYSIAVIDGTGVYKYLLDKDVNYLREAYPAPTSLGIPKYYALFGPQLALPTELSFIIAPTPDTTYGLELHYYYYPESIVTAGTSWLGDNYDPVLFYGAMREAMLFMKGEADLVGYYDQKYSEALNQLKRLGDGLERSDAYRNGQTRIPNTAL